ncbi:piggybac transposable element-derived protein 4 [Holotrichia oblita]|uniref:Piggybac transposable element-derived protein 4 n=1 Tax=Holotrichia oblita TaxID=644536 RepID=A0ACB9TBF7_HOLOL|nr:piggybac transposable element-derived protein 4 [Holotrichia oblita]
MEDIGVRFERGVTLQEALTMIEDDEDFCRKTEEIILYPPVNACEDQTDEDSGDEFDLSLNNLPGSQLGAVSEVKFHSDDEWSSDDDIPLSTFMKSSKHMRNNNAKDKKKYNWENIDLTPDTSTFENETIFTSTNIGKNSVLCSSLQKLFLAC